MKLTLSFITISLFAYIHLCSQTIIREVNDADSWENIRQAGDNLTILPDGTAAPTNESADFSFTSKIIEFNDLVDAQDIVFKQSDVWDNWIPVANVGPSGAKNAPVLISVKDGEYYFLAAINGNTAYHAWLSNDMVNWELKGPVTGPNHTSGRWTTTAEYKDGQFYIYYDSTNDEKPALFIDGDLTDGILGQDFGVVYDDPTNGSDCSVFRDDADGLFHIIYEDWTPINASTHSWDSPLAGHVSSPDGINGFEFGEHPNVIDHRTTATGQIGTYNHPQQGVLEYEIHSPEQDAYGDFTTIKVGGQYYIFGDYEQVGQGIRLARFSSNSLYKEFDLVGSLGNGHPDPTVGFAEGQFYLITQQSTDYVSPGPWVDGVSARVGVDIDGDGTIDQRTAWQNIKEYYNHKDGYIRVVETEEAKINLSSLPSGYGFQFEFQVENAVVAEVSPLMDRVTMSFSGDAPSGDNLALNQPTTQSTTGAGGVASRAVDGNTSGVWQNGSVTHTQRVSSLNPWWRVDLGETYNVDDISIYNRTDRNLGSRLEGAKVYVGNIDSSSPDDYTAVGTLTSDNIQHFGAIKTSGRYVMVRIEGEGILSLAEVEVYGNQETSSVSFVPDPNKSYYIDVPAHDLRLAATGTSEDAFTTSTNTTGANVEWKFVDKGNGFWHIQRAAGGSKPRLRTDNSEFADMQATGSSGIYTYYTFNAGASANTHYITLPDGPKDHQRLQIAADGLVRFVTTASQGTSVSFSITEVPSSNCNTISDVNFEASWGVWNDGGADCAAINNNTYSNSGTWSIRLRDNSGAASSMFTDVLNMSAASEAIVSFSFLPISFETNENFFLEVSSNGGSTYTVVENWIVNQDFTNGQRQDVQVTVGANNLSNNTRFRIRCDASGNGDIVYIDDVVIESCSTSGPAEKPNFIFIMVDDLGKEWVSTYGATEVETPNIDALADNGIKFNNAYSMPQCTPSRVALLTGQSPYANGWINHYDVPRWGHGANFDADQNPSFAKALREEGYRTCAAGKWQINDFRVEPDAMVKAGFDEFCMWTGFELGNTPSSQRYWDPYIHTKEGSRTYEGQFGPDVFSDFIVDFMEENKEDPMCIYYPMVLTHTPFVSTPFEPNLTTNYEKHQAMVRYTDFIIGKLVDALKDLDLEDNTYLVFTTDNGTVGGVIGPRDDVYVKGSKSSLSEAGINAPFLVITPNGINYETDALIDFTDIYATLLDLAGAQQSAGLPGSGTSFANVLLGNQQESQKDWILSMGGSPASINDDGKVVNFHTFRDRIIREGQYKAYVSTNKEVYRIYDLANDPYETQNLIDQSSISAVQNRFINIVNTLPNADGQPIYEIINSDVPNTSISGLNNNSERQNTGIDNKNMVPLSTCEAFVAQPGAEGNCPAAAQALTSALYVSPVYGQKAMLQWSFTQFSNKKVEQYLLKYGNGKGTEMSSITTIPAEDAEGLIGYEFIHETPNPGTNVYQVIAQYEDGTENHQMVGELAFTDEALNDDQNRLAIAPNPATNLLMIDIGNYLGKVLTYTISDIQGSTVLSGNFTSDHQATMEVDLADFQNGMYIIQVKAENQRTVAAKFMVAKDY